MFPLEIYECCRKSTFCNSVFGSLKATTISLLQQEVWDLRLRAADLHYVTYIAARLERCDFRLLYIGQQFLYCYHIKTTQSFYLIDLSSKQRSIIFLSTSVISCANVGRGGNSLHKNCFIPVFRTHIPILSSWISTRKIPACLILLYQIVYLKKTMTRGRFLLRIILFMVRLHLI